MRRNPPSGREIESLDQSLCLLCLTIQPDVSNTDIKQIQFRVSRSNDQDTNRYAKKVSPKSPQPGAPALALPNLEVLVDDALEIYRAKLATPS